MTVCKKVRKKGKCRIVCKKGGKVTSVRKCRRRRAKK